MKGRLSAKDESKLAYEIISLNTFTGKLMVKECLWNDQKRIGHFSWGQEFELSLW